MPFCEYSGSFLVFVYYIVGYRVGICVALFDIAKQFARVLKAMYTFNVLKVPVVPHPLEHPKALFSSL